jgi:hypothetical protein
MIDYFTKDNLQKLLELYITSYKIITGINEYLINNDKKHKKIRHQNFPSEISENIVKFIINNQFNIYSNWNTQKGDLNNGNVDIEVKCFSSKGPISFGPTESWNELYILDATDFINYNYKLYKIDLSNKCDNWKKIKVNKKETYSCKCKKGQRPRINFDNIKEQIPLHLTLVYDNNINELLK